MAAILSVHLVRQPPKMSKIRSSSTSVSPFGFHVLVWVKGRMKKLRGPGNEAKYRGETTSLTNLLPGAMASHNTLYSLSSIDSAVVHTYCRLTLSPYEFLAHKTGHIIIWFA